MTRPRRGLARGAHRLARDGIYRDPAAPVQRPRGHHTHGNLNVLNLVQGEAAVIESSTQAFAPFEVHYAETFIVPAAVGAYTIRPLGSAGGEHATMKAFVRLTYSNS